MKLKTREMEKGITLISLVVTIIILIILAGISINLVLGDNGIITKAQEAKEKSSLAEVQTLASMIWSEIYMHNMDKPEQEKLDYKTEIINRLEKQNIDTSKYNIEVTDKNVIVTSKEEIPILKATTPLLVDTSSFLWMRKESKTLQTGKSYTTQDSFYVTASAGSGQIKIISGTGIERLSQTDTMWGAAIMYDDGTCKPCIVTAVDTTNKVITIYPPNESEITNGRLEPLYSDSQHLSELGYKALMQYMYNVNPKYCDRIVAYDRYAPTSGEEMNTPYVRLAGSPAIYPSKRNDWIGWSMSQSVYGTFMIPYTDYLTEGEYGFEREISLDGQEGFYETYIGTVYYAGVTDTSKIVKDKGYELHIEWHIDGNLVSKTLKDTNYVERFCFDIPKEASTAKIKVYYTKMRNNKDDTISIGDSTVWINTGNYGSKLITNGASVVQMFDSWGAFWNEEDTVVENGISYRQGASGKELQRLLGPKATFFNRSIEGMTSRYGKAWFNEIVADKNPDYVLLNYGINDENSSNGAVLENIVGPDGNSIDMSVAITQDEFVNNMYEIFKSAEKNGITPIYICGSVAQLPEWITAFISDLASLYEMNGN